MIKVDREKTANILYTVLCVISVLSLTMYPYVPFSSEKLHTYLGFSGTIKELGWKLQYPTAGQKLEQPQALFTKLDESIIEEETARLGHVSGN